MTLFMNERGARRIFVVHVEDVPGVLNRVASLFRRRGFNIESLTVGRTHEPGVSRMTIVVHGDDRMGRLVAANLYKLVDVVRVDDITHEAAVIRGLTLVRVRATAAQRDQITQVCEAHGARVADVAHTTMVVEATGDEQAVGALVALLEPFGIEELAQTGTIVMTRGSAAASIKRDGGRVAVDLGHPIA